MLEIPDSFNEEDIFPQTVAGKIDLMVTIGKELIQKVDDMSKVFEVPITQQTISDLQLSDRINLLSTYAMKLASIVHLQTECIEQLYGELKTPEDHP
jgi:hypothetical protein